MQTKNTFIHFPISLLRELPENRQQVISDIIAYGVYNFSKRLKADPVSVAKHTAYTLYNDKQSKLRLMLQHFAEYLEDEGFADTRGFNGIGDFNPVFEIKELLQMFNDNEAVRNYAIEHYRTTSALKLLNVSASPDDLISRANKVEQKIKPDSPSVSISVKHLLNYLGNKNEVEVMQLLMYLAIRSIMGKKNYCKTNFDLIRARMFGFASEAEVDQLTKLTGLYFKYSKRHHYDKIMMRLKLDWGIITHANKTRGLYVSHKSKMSLQELVTVAENKKLTNRIKALKEEHAEANLFYKQSHW